MIEMLEETVFQKPVEVLIIFPKPEKHITKLRGLCQNAVIDYDRIEADLKALSRQCE
ncbi:hypothetical protein U27_06034 [Candidatus Vecturithrix granuli]|uniref:Uncharacterized protein n=1 Tax=Vecturithrix granuli TaxID=1499967 RepID=A0A081C3A3_VECG1|nr:hypothetical protein U27_06034 [Candidatus Vecturithrix granuli]